MKKKIAVLMDPLDHILWEKDTTILLLKAAQARGHAIYYTTRDDLSCRMNQPSGFFRKIHFVKEYRKHSVSEEKEIALSEFDVLLMRQDPPFDSEYYYATVIAEQAAKQGLLIINHPKAIRDHNEKLAILDFPEWIPPTLVSRDMQVLNATVKEWGKSVVKPLDGMGGGSVFILDPADPNRQVILETVTQEGTRTVMLQQYLPAIENGDNRILLVKGRPLPGALSRIPQAGDHRGNMARGGKPVARALSPTEQKIADTIGPILYERGLYFVGLDVIGDKITEINVTSPTGLRELAQTFSWDVGELFWEPIGF